MLGVAATVVAVVLLLVAAPTVVVTAALRQFGPQMVHDADEGKRLLCRSKSGFIRLHVVTELLAFFVAVTIVNVFGEFFNQSIRNLVRCHPLVSACTILLPFQLLTLILQLISE